MATPPHPHPHRGGRWKDRLELLGRRPRPRVALGTPAARPCLSSGSATSGRARRISKIRMPEPAVVDRLADALHALLASLRA